MAKLSRSRHSHIVGDVLCFRSTFHVFLCIASLVLGFRLANEAVFFINVSSTGSLFLRRSGSKPVESLDVSLRFPYIPDDLQDSKSVLPNARSEQIQILDENVTLVDDNSRHVTFDVSSGKHIQTFGKSSRVSVGRHEILIRAWPHPDPAQTSKAHQLIDLVQYQQKLLYGPRDEQKPLIIITPTTVRTFQALHLRSLINTLRSVPAPLTWIVVEAGGVSNETFSLLESCRLSYYHLEYPSAMPASDEQRSQLEIQLRVEGLRFVRDRQLDGIVLFLDDSNTYSLDIFTEARKTNWFGSFSVGILRLIDTSNPEAIDRKTKERETVQIEGPVCDSKGQFAGWYVQTETQNRHDIMNLKWTGFSLNAKLLWKSEENPKGFKMWNQVLSENDSSIRSPLQFVKNMSLMEPLGNCGRDVLSWWLRAEARTDSKFPSRWEIDPHLEITVASKRTPWPTASRKYPLSSLSLIQSLDAFKESYIKQKNQRSKGRGRRSRKHKIDL